MRWVTGVWWIPLHPRVACVRVRYAYGYRRRCRTTVVESTCTWSMCHQDKSSRHHSPTQTASMASRTLRQPCWWRWSLFGRACFCLCWSTCRLRHSWRGYSSLSFTGRHPLLFSRNMDGSNLVLEFCVCVFLVTPLSPLPAYTCVMINVINDQIFVFSTQFAPLALLPLPKNWMRHCSSLHA